LLDGLDAKYRATHTIVPGECLHLFMVGMSSTFSGRGIAQNLVSTSLENGKIWWYQVAFTEATGSASRHLFRKLGFQDLLSATYKTFLFKGRHVFESMSDVIHIQPAVQVGQQPLETWPQLS
jgi:ribosomal protein S18 acetylase RimI-like enzyme